MEVTAKKEQGKSMTRQMEEINTEISRFDFAIAVIMADLDKWNTFAMIQANSKKLEAAYKGYILGVVQNNKKLRVKYIKILKHLMEHVIPNLREFKEHWNAIENCDKDIPCTHNNEKE
jgi:hypothetical protein